MEEYRHNLNKKNEFFDRLEPYLKNDENVLNHSQKDNHEGKFRVNLKRTMNLTMIMLKALTIRLHPTRTSIMMKILVVLTLII